MIWWIVFGIIGAPLTLFLHELSHYLVLKFKYKADIIYFRPWPDFSRDTGKLGVVRYRLPEGVTDAKWSHIAPFLKSMILVPVWSLLSLLFFPLILLAAWELIDEGKWLFDYMRNSDHRTDAYKWRN